MPFYARHSRPRDSIPQAYQDNPLDIHRTSHFAGICLRLPVAIVRYQNPKKKTSSWDALTRVSDRLKQVEVKYRALHCYDIA